jgi:hypothetical protein
MRGMSLDDMAHMENPTKEEDKYMRYTKPQILKFVNASSSIASIMAKHPSTSNDNFEVLGTPAAGYDGDE